MSSNGKSAPPHAELWAKSRDAHNRQRGELLLTHSIRTALMVQRLCRQLPLPGAEREELERRLTAACAYHDLGKAASGFQNMMRHPEQVWKHWHETLSAALAFHLDPHFDPCALFAILTHHRSIPESGSGGREKTLPWDELPPDFGGYGESTWSAMLAELRDCLPHLNDLLNRLARTLHLHQQPLTEQTPLTNLGINAFWLQREARYQRRLTTEQKWRASLMRGLLITSDHLASARGARGARGERLTPPAVPRLSDYREQIQAAELPAGCTLLPFQRRAGETLGDAVLKAPTGSGKTLAAMLWAAHNQSENGRFFYVLPYTASINAMTDRFRGIFPEETVGVLHHRNAAYLFRQMENEPARERNQIARLLAGLAREMYHPIRVCTPHQILRFALRGRGWEYGLAEFQNACFVFDEIHAFEPLITGLTLATIKLLRDMGARVLFASATIPRFLERHISEHLGIFASNILAPNPDDDLDRVVCDKLRHKINVRPGTMLNDLPRIVDEIEESGQTALLVCNHVATSQLVRLQLSEAYGFDPVLLHARFNSEDRIRIEKQITGKEKPRILVATQAVEVSLDIDYDRGYTEPAPADALGQRLGRINRKGSRPPAPVVVYEEPHGGYLYDRTLTDETIARLREVDKLSEADLVRIVDEVYRDGYVGPALDEFKRGLGNQDISQFRQRIIPGSYRSWVDDILDQTDGQIEVLPDVLTEEYDERCENREYIGAELLLVPIRIGQKFKAEKMGALYYDEERREHITTLGYSSSLGLDLSSRSDNLF